MDRDEFARATRLGRIAAENLCGTLQGAPCDLVHVARLLDLLLSRAGGVPSLPGVLARIGEPLLVRFTPDVTLDAIRVWVRSCGAGTLDLQLERAADRYVSGGGLDARGLVGAFVRSLVERFVFDARGGVVDQLRPALAHEVRHPPGHGTNAPFEMPQRSRGFVFLSLGAVVAHAFRRPHFSVYEPGIGAINSPINEAQIGAQATRAVHPGTLLRMERLLRLVLDRAVAIDLPFTCKTKSEVCVDAQPGTVDLASVAVSCDEGDRGRAKTELGVHCGLCTSCLFRRVALHCALGTADPTRYKMVRTEIHTGYELNAYHQYALRLKEAATSYRTLLQLDPLVREGRAYLVSRGAPHADAERKLVEVFRRYASEILQFYEDVQPTVRRSTTAARSSRETPRDLFAVTR